MTSWAELGSQSLALFVFLSLVRLLTPLTISFLGGGGKRKFQIQGWSSANNHPRVTTKAPLPWMGPPRQSMPAAISQAPLVLCIRLLAASSLGHFLTSPTCLGLPPRSGLQGDWNKGMSYKGSNITISPVLCSLYNTSVLNVSSRHPKHVLPGQCKMLFTPSSFHDWALPTSRH